MEDRQSDIPMKAEISPLRGISGLWFIPFIAVLVGGWMVYNNWANQGAQITISFLHADGLEAGKTKIKIRSVDVGKVEKITLNDNLDGVLVTVRMSNKVDSLLVEDTQFWVVQPRIGFSGVSGLGTLLSGQYIEFSPGESDNQVSHFEGLDTPPLTPLGTPGLHVTLNTEGEFSFSEGDPIHYQGFKVGKIEDVYFNTSERMIYYNAFIEAPYHHLVTTNTRFWNETGVRAEISQDGITIQTGSFETIIQGGVSFSVPDGELLGERVTERAYYYVYPSRSATHEKKYAFAVDYVVMVDGSVGGLKVGAPVMYRGLLVGKVKRIDFLISGRNLLDKGMKIPIYIELHPGRLGLEDSDVGSRQAKSDLDQWVQEGLIATLKSQNLLLGQRLVELSYQDSNNEIQLAHFNDTPIIPTGKDSISRITDRIEGILAKVDELPLASIGVHVDGLLFEASQTLDSINQLVQSGEQVVIDAKRTELVKTLRDTLAQVDLLAQSFSDDSETNRDIQRLLETAAGVFAELKPLLTALKNKPNGLIFTTSDGPEPEPKRKGQ